MNSAVSTQRVVRHPNYIIHVTLTLQGFRLQTQIDVNSEGRNASRLLSLQLMGSMIGPTYILHLYKYATLYIHFFLKYMYSDLLSLL